MTGKELLQNIPTVHGREIFEFLYGVEGIGEVEKRYVGLVNGMLDFAPAVGTGALPEVAADLRKADLRIFTAAGRTELGGNHTDHNQGKVLAGSVNLDTVAVVAKRPDKTVVFRSTGYADAVVDLSDLSVHAEEKGTAEALIRGIAQEFAARGAAIGGWIANASSTVLAGSGLSSSASVEVLFGKIFDSLYGDGKRTALEIAQIGQKAENAYFGKPSGLMDQIACAWGGAVAIDFADANQVVVKPVDFDPEDAGFVLCIVNTGSNHADLLPDYAAIPQEMFAVANFFGKKNLRSLNLESVLARASEVRKAAGDRALLRSIHFFKENQRVDRMAEALAQEGRNFNEGRNFADFLDLVSQSGDSSWELLQNISASGRPQEQEIALALALTKDFLETGAKSLPVSGSCRVHGGGFAGTIQAYIPLSLMSGYTKRMEAVFGKDAVTVLKIRKTGAAELFF